MRDTFGHEPPRGLAQHPVERLVHPPDGDPAAGAVPRLADRDRDHVLAHVHRRAPLVQDLHDTPPGKTKRRACRPQSPWKSKETDTRVHDATGGTPEGRDSSVNL